MSDINPTQLERELAELASANNLTRIDIGFCGGAYGPGHRFVASCHFDDAMLGQIPCASGHGDTIDAAIEAMLPVLAHKRAVAGDSVKYGAPEPKYCPGYCVVGEEHYGPHSIVEAA